MASLADTHTPSVDVALRAGVTSVLANVAAAFTGLGRAIEFTRRCEAEFSRTGRISPETLDALSPNA